MPLGTDGECCGQETGSSSCQVLNLPQTRGRSCISWTTFAVLPGLVLLWGGAALLLGLLLPFLWLVKIFAASALAGLRNCSGEDTLRTKPWLASGSGTHRSTKAGRAEDREAPLLPAWPGFLVSGDWVRFCRSAQLIRCFPAVHLASSQSGLSPSLPCSDSYCTNRSGAKTFVHPGAEHAACKCVSWWQKGKKMPVPIPQPSLLQNLEVPAAASGYHQSGS